MFWNILIEEHISHENILFLSGLYMESSQQNLLQVLKAYTQYKPEEGYCQGQGPVAAVLLMNMPAEVQCCLLFTFLSMNCLSLCVYIEMWKKNIGTLPVKTQLN